jgi:hypothetical protein
MIQSITKITVQIVNHKNQKTMKKQFYTTLFCFTFMYAPMQAQQEQTMHFLNNIWQANLTNPALLPSDYKVNIAVSSFYVNYNAPITVNDLIVKKGIKKTLTPLNPSYLDKLDPYNYVESNFQWQTLALSFPISKYFSLSLHHAIYGNGYAEFDKNTLTFLFNGNSPFIGKTTNLDNRIDASIYNEFAAGITYKIDNVSFGFRLKGLNGIKGAFSSGNKLKLKTDNTIYALQLDNDYQLLTFDPSVSTLEKLGRNGGFVADIGVAVKLQRLQVAASVINLGRGIYWKHGGTTYASRGTSDFSGFDSYDVGKTTYNDLTKNIKESLKFEVIDQAAYLQKLPVQVYLSGIYEINPKVEMGGLFYAEQSDIETKYGLTLNATAKLIRGLNVGLSYNLRNTNQNSVGIHATANLFKTLQFYFVTDNLRMLTNPYDSPSVNGRMGLNLTFGEVKDAKSKLKKRKKGEVESIRQ